MMAIWRITVARFRIMWRLSLAVAALTERVERLERRVKELEGQ